VKREYLSGDPMKMACRAGMLALCLAGGCRYGLTVESFPPARAPKGVTSKITTNRARFVAELIEVRDDGIVIFAQQRFRLLPYSVIVSSRFDGMSSADTISDRRPPKPAARERLRLVSRFPQGLSPELLQKLLEANGQTELGGEIS